jgi:hypothetical protein
MLFRPEFRYDHSDRPVFGGDRQNQFTFSLGALFTF